MLETQIDPAVPPARANAAPATDAPEAFVQTIRLTNGRETIGQARWHCGADVTQGVAQVLELWVTPAKRRSEFGRRLMEAVTAQATQYFKSRGGRIRRLWIAVEQKRQVIGRSFLMQFGFHHVGTVQELLKEEDLLIYMRTFD